MVTPVACPAIFKRRNFPSRWRLHSKVQRRLLMPLRVLLSSEFQEERRHEERTALVRCTLACQLGTSEIMRCRSDSPGLRGDTVIDRLSRREESQTRPCNAQNALWNRLNQYATACVLEPHSRRTSCNVPRPATCRTRFTALRRTGQNSALFILPLRLIAVASSRKSCPL